ncbi:MAG: hypothetical protein ACKVS8_03140 [Phycisphaerales bacterium]
MSQLGMQMPGGSRRASTLNVYTGLLFLAVVALATASVMVYVGAAKVGRAGDPFAMQDAKRIEIRK